MAKNKYFHCKKIIKLDQILYEQIKTGQEFLSDLTFDAISKYADKMYLNLEIELISYILVLVGCFLFVWIPYILKRRKEIYLNREFISLIPQEYILKIKAFRKFFSQVIFSANS